MHTERYFEAKTFLKSIKDAHICVKTSLREKNQLEFKQFQINNLHENLKNKNININNNIIEVNESFKNSKHFKLNQFMKELRNNYFSNLNGVSDYQSMKEMLLSTTQKLE